MKIRFDTKKSHFSLFGGTPVLSAALLLGGCGSRPPTVLPGAGASPFASLPSGPILGYIFSPTDGTLRAMLGVRGSAQMSASIVVPGVYIAGGTSVASSTALLVDASGSLSSISLPASQPTHLADGLSANAQVIFSASGQNAIVYTPGKESILLISGLPSAVRVKAISVPLSTSVAAIAISDAGTMVVASRGVPAIISLLTAEGQISPLAHLSGFGDFTFLPGSDTLLLADNAANKVFLVRQVTSDPSTQALSLPGVNRPLKVAASLDGRWAVIANGGDNTILRVDLSGASGAAKLLCDCTPSEMSSLAGGGAFRVNSLYSGPVWTVDVSGASPQLLFVPGIRKGTP